MTFNEARIIIRELGMTISRRPDGEYRVNYRGACEPTAYYTQDLDDAVGTAKEMHRWLHKDSYIA
jgi:hypothetical protein